MPGIVTYNDLKSSVADWLLRTDLTSVIPTFIDNAENRLRRDPRVRRLISTTLDTVASTATVSLPNDFVGIESLYHDGPTHYGPIEIVSSGQLGQINQNVDSAEDRPSHAAVINQSTVRFAPVPDAIYNLQMTYWGTITHLTDTFQQNWLLASHPDIYLYASLVESAPYLKEDPRVQTWETELEKRLEELHKNTERGQFSGTLTRRVDNHIP